ncbi:MAG: LAGLIDADG family homing endonuclease, partial [Fusobacteriaceae bacterium]
MVNKGRDMNEVGFVISLWGKLSDYRIYKRTVIAEEFFMSEAAKTFYTIGLQMFEGGYKKIDRASVLSHVSKSKGLESLFDKYGGYQTYEDMKPKVKDGNTEGYFSNVQKAVVLCKLREIGIDVDGHYAKLSQMNVEQIRRFYSFNVNNAFMDSNTTVVVEDMQITDDDFAYFEEGSSMGFSIASVAPLLNYELLGLDKGLTFLGGMTNSGKAQPLYSKVLTATGFVEMGSLTVGDEIVGKDGKIHNVVGVFPQGRKPSYRVTFTDGSSTESCDEHIWNVSNKNWKRKHSGTFRNLTLKEVMSQGLILPRKDKIAYKWTIPVCDEVKSFKEVPHFISPYILGVLLGDGYLSGQSLQFSTSEMDIINNIKLDLKEGYSINKSKGNNYGWIIKGRNDSGRNGYLSELKKLGLRDSLSRTKFIPKEYLLDSIENRKALLKGLFDTDGCVGKGSHCGITTMSEQLKSDIVWLCNSLGMTTSVTSDNREKYKGGTCYKISIHAKCPTDLFSSEKHSRRYSPRKSRFTPTRTIKSIEYIGEVEMQCIMVDADDNLYITDDFIVTHNTSFVMAVFIRAWMKAKVKSCIISNEQTIREFKRLLIAMVGYELFGESGFSRRRIKTGQFNERQTEMFRAIQKHSNEHYGKLIKFCKIYDYSMDDVAIIVDTYSALGFEAFVYDVFKADDDTDKAVIGEMKKASKELFKTADRNQVTIIATVQLGIGFEDMRFIGMRSISTSKQIVEPAHTVLLLRTLWDDEATGEKYDIECWNYKLDSNGIKVPKGDG